MSVKLMGLVWDRYPEGGGELNLALKLADHAHDDGTRIFPAVDTLAERTRQSKRAVQYQLRRMEEIGWLQTVAYPKGGRGRAREYRISAEWINGAELAPFEDPEKLSTKGAEIAPIRKRKGAKRDTKPCNPEHERVQSETQNHATAVAPQQSVNVIEPSGNREAAQKAGGALPTKFDRFWQIWPASQRKVDKSDCRKHWDKHNLDAKAEVIIAHVQAMKLTKQWKDGFEPAPSTYLNGKRWEDELPPTESEADAQAELAEWWLNASATEAMGEQVGFRKRYTEEPLPQYRVHVAKQCGKGPWIDYVLKHAQTSGSQKFYEWVRAQLGDGLLPPDDYAS
jgi:hypothetical protein